MSTTDAPPSFYCCREGLAELIDAGAGMGVVERTINAYALDRDEKDALWLWARGRHDQLPATVLIARSLVGRHARSW